MKLDIKHPPEFWEEFLGVRIIDADGWKPETWNEPVTREDFLLRASKSTASYPRGFFDKYPMNCIHSYHV